MHINISSLFNAIWAWICQNIVPDQKKPHQKSLEDIHKYWEKPWDGKNLPQDYIKKNGEVLGSSLLERSIFLGNIIKEYAKPDAKILEIGCNVGRNTNYLFNSGYENIEAIEISEDAIKLLKKSFPQMGNRIKIHNNSVEDIISNFEDNTFDLCFTMAVLEHIHIESEFIFTEMVRVTKNTIITIEDEKKTSWRHFPRNYKNVFESRNMKQLKQFNKVDGLSKYFVARIFKKNIM